MFNTIFFTGVIVVELIVAIWIIISEKKREEKENARKSHKTSN